MSRISSLYEGLIRASMEGSPAWLPADVQRNFINLVGYEHADAMLRLVGDRRRVLLIGDAGGRDYYFLRLAGKEVTAADVAPQANIRDLVVADVTQGLPFPPGSFDAVVMADVLEHLLEDRAALGHVRTVLKDDGYLVLAVPFYNDSTPTHVRLHSPVTLERLLASAGFRIEEYVERGGLMTLESLRVWPWLWHGLHLLLWKLTGRTHYGRLLRWLTAADWWLGRRRFRLLRWSGFYGARLRCVKARSVDFRERNIQDFTDHVQHVAGARTGSAD